MLPLIAGAGALYIGAKMVGKMFGSDPDFTQAWMLNRMTGQGGFLKTFFQDGLASLFVGSRTGAVTAGMIGRMPLGGMPLAASLYGGPMTLNPYMMNYAAMGAMPYSPLGMGMRAWL